jgi:hypothetical protein
VSERHVDDDATFIDLLLSGDALQDDVDDFVDAWHEAEPDSSAATLELSEFLGMNEDEYGLWVEQPTSVQFIVYAHKYDRPVLAVIQALSTAGVAARAADQSEAKKLLRWLKETGRIEGDE